MKRTVVIGPLMHPDDFMEMMARVYDAKQGLTPEHLFSERPENLGNKLRRERMVELEARRAK